MLLIEGMVLQSRFVFPHDLQVVLVGLFTCTVATLQKIAQFLVLQQLLALELVFINVVGQSKGVVAGLHEEKVCNRHPRPKDVLGIELVVQILTNLSGVARLVHGALERLEHFHLHQLRRRGGGDVRKPRELVHAERLFGKVDVQDLHQPSLRADSLTFSCGDVPRRSSRWNRLQMNLRMGYSW